MQRTFNGLVTLGLVLLFSTTTFAQGNGNGGGGGGKNKASLSISVTPQSFSETDAGAIGTVTRQNSDPGVPLTVTVTSSDATEAKVSANDGTEATVSASVVIPAGQVAVNFSVVAVDDTEADGDQQVTISASATGHSGASAVITVLDNEGGGDTGALPPVRYRISYVPLLSGASYFYLNDLNDLGQAVGWSDIDGKRHATLVDAIAGTSVLLADLIVVTSIPEGFRLASAVGINNRGVVVGYLQDAGNLRHPFAIDLSLQKPVVDLLPHPGGVSAFPSRINDRGDIVGSYALPDASGSAPWHFNPNLYGPEELRVTRDGNNDQLPDELPLDLRWAEYTDLFNEIGYAGAIYALSEPDYDNGLPAQFVKTTQQGVVRFTVPDDILDPTSLVSPHAEWFPEIDSFGAVRGINNFGVWVGQGALPTGKGKQTKTANFRYGTSLEILPVDVPTFPIEINDLGEVLFDDGTILRDWGDGQGQRPVNFGDLVVFGNEADLKLWQSSNVVTRYGTEDTGIIMGILQDGPYFVAIEEPAN